MAMTGRAGRTSRSSGDRQDPDEAALFVGAERRGVAAGRADHLAQGYDVTVVGLAAGRGESRAELATAAHEVALGGDVPRLLERRQLLGQGRVGERQLVL